MTDLRGQAANPRGYIQSVDRFAVAHDTYTLTNKPLYTAGLAITQNSFTHFSERFREK